MHPHSETKKAAAKRYLGRFDRVPTLIALALASLSVMANPQHTVDRALQTFESFVADPDMRWFANNIGQAQGILIIPNLGKGAFIVGASGGQGVLLQRDPQSGVWSYPSFTGTGGVSFGFQVGGMAAEVIMLIMTQRGMEAMHSTDFKIGSGFGIAVGPMGGGAAVATRDVYSFSRSKGLWGGFIVDGAVFRAQPKRNKIFYGRPVSATDILVRRTVSNAGADPLRRALANTAGGGVDVVNRYELRVIQGALKAKGYDPGAVDGIMGPNTERAIRQFQQANGLEITGQPSSVLQSRLTET